MNTQRTIETPSRTPRAVVAVLVAALVAALLAATVTSGADSTGPMAPAFGQAAPEVEAEHHLEDEGLPKVKIIATGGTIANSADGRLSVESVLENVPEIAEYAEVEIEDYIRVGSSSITLDNEIGIYHTITQILEDEPDVDGIVITHGSNTSEETAYLMNLTVDTDVPIVVVAAQRQQFTLSEDGSRNLLEAVRVAASPDAKGMGAMLVVNQSIHYSRDVTKELGGGRTDTWESGELGVLGYADSDSVRFYRKPLLRHTSTSEFTLDGIEEASELPKVEVIYSTLDADGTLVDALVAAGYDGIVVGAFPTGSPTPAQREALARAEEAGVVVVTGNRGHGARIPSNDTRLGADDLSLQKSRLLLMMALTVTDDPDELRRIFAEY